MNFDVKKIKLEIGYYLAGFVDAEGCFCISFSPSTKVNSNNINTFWKVNPIFNVSQKERHIIAQFKKHLQCGTVITNKKTQISTYTVTSLFAVRNNIIPFFKKFGFQSAKKKKDFSNFVQVLDILENSPILNKNNIEQILALRVNTTAVIANRVYSDQVIRSSLNNPNYIEEIKKSSETNTPNSEIIENSDNEMIESDLYGDIKAENALKLYIAGFADGDGSFNVSFRKRDDYSIGWKINPCFSISQTDEILLKLFQKTLDCGKIRKASSEGIFYLEVVDKNDIQNKIIPFFKNYPLLSENGRNKFERFCKTLDILAIRSLSRFHVEEILQLQRNEKKKTKYTPDHILARFDEFSKKKI